MSALLSSPSSSPSEREEEYEALLAIYGADALTILRNESGPALDVVRYATDSFIITCQIPALYGFPMHCLDDSSLPEFKVRLLHHTGSSSGLLASIYQGLAELIDSNRGQVTLFPAIEYVRDKLELAVGTPDVGEVNIQDGFPDGPPEILVNEYYHIDEEQLLDSTSMPIIHGEVLIERKSSFQSHICQVASMEDVHEFRRQVLADKRIARATHNIFAYRFTNPLTGVCYHDNDDDGETAAGTRLAEMIRLMGIDGVAVIVTRWFGGTLLGPDRFKYICNSARKLLEDSGYGVAGSGCSIVGSKKVLRK
jgi:hypothetical protein